MNWTDQIPTTPGMYHLCHRYSSNRLTEYRHCDPVIIVERFTDGLKCRRPWEVSWRDLEERFKNDPLTKKVSSTLTYSGQLWAKDEAFIPWNATEWRNTLPTREGHYYCWDQLNEYYISPRDVSMGGEFIIIHWEPFHFQVFEPENPPSAENLWFLPLIPVELPKSQPENKPINHIDLFRDIV